MISSEVIKGIQRNFRSPKEREEFARRKRKNDHILDRVERQNNEYHSSVNRRTQDKLASTLEEKIYGLRQRGEIQGGSTKHTFSIPLPTV